MELTIKSLSKQYGKKTAVNHFTATLTPGVYGLLGANGAGKTTLMRMLCDVLRPTSGQILLDGIPSTVLGEAYREKLGYLPQNFGYYPNFSGQDFMLYLAALKGLPRLTARERSDQLLHQVGLYDVRKKKIRSYSGGMRQRLGIAQALLNDPQILVLDEPTAGLDPKERSRFRNIIAGMGADRIVLLSTHIVSDVASTADQIFIMKQGRLALQGRELEICRAICGKVWSMTLPEAEGQALCSQAIVSNLHHSEGLLHLRLIAETQPHPAAAPVEPNLEDLYLYFFREEEES